MKKKKKLLKSKIICSKCKTEKKTVKKQMEKLIGVFGSLELVHEKYHCIECRRKYNVRRDGRPKPIVKKRIPKKLSAGLPKWMWNLNKDKLGITGPFYFKKPKGLSEKEWQKRLRATVEWGIKTGRMVPVENIRT